MTQHDLNLHGRGVPVFRSIERGPLDFWQSACDSIFDLTPIDRDETDEDYAVSAWFVEPVTFSRSNYAQMINRHRQRHIAEAGQQIFVHRYNRGGATLQTSSSLIDCEPGGITLLDYAHAFDSIHAHSQCDGVFVPHSAINFTPSATAVKYYGPKTLLGQMLSRELDFFLARLEAGANELDPLDLLRLLGCVELALSPDQPSMTAWAQAQASMTRMIKAFIETHLTSSDLSVTLILNTFAVSRASLYRMFESYGGVRNYITRRRLQGAIMELASEPLARGQISAAAEKYGFSSDVTFNRAVHREFGTSPGGLFQMPIQRLETPRPKSVVHQLMTRAASPVV